LCLLIQESKAKLPGDVQDDESKYTILTDSGTGAAPASQLFDNNLATNWNSVNSFDGKAYITWSTPTPIRVVEFSYFGFGDSTHDVNQFTISFSDDGVTYSQAGTFNGVATATEQFFTLTSDGVPHKYWKWDILSTHSGSFSQPVIYEARLWTNVGFVFPTPTTTTTPVPVTPTPSPTTAPNPPPVAATIIISWPNPSAYSRPITVIVKSILPDTRIPTGLVTLYEQTTLITTGTLINGQIQFLTDKFGVRPQHYLLTITYSGDTNFLSSSIKRNQQISKDGTFMKITSSANPSRLGHSVTFTATVFPQLPGVHIPRNGQVTWKIGTTILKTSTLTHGKVTLTLPHLPLGITTVKAHYLGNVNYLSTGAKILQHVTH